MRIKNTILFIVFTSRFNAQEIIIRHTASEIDLKKQQNVAHWDLKKDIDYCT